MTGKLNQVSYFTVLWYKCKNLFIKNGFFCSEAGQFKKRDLNHLVLGQIPFRGPNESEIKQKVKGLSIKINMRWRIEG